MRIAETCKLDTEYEISISNHLYVSCAIDSYRCSGKEMEVDGRT
jgi:hypothetical protein